MFPVPLGSFNDQERHDYILRTYVFNKNDEQSRRHKRDVDVIKENHKFLWDDADVPNSWETRLAKKYYDKLFKEYCIADLSRYRENKIAMRWRTEQEVVTGTGQFQCGSRKCEAKDSLRSWEVNFGYLEQGEKRNALVKLRLCPEHSVQLNYTSRKREVKRLKHIDSRKAKEAKRKKLRDDTTIDVQKNSSDENSDKDKTAESIVAITPSELNTKTADVTSNDTDADLEVIWSKKPEVESETSTRETDFERYLEDLLL